MDVEIERVFGPGANVGALQATYRKVAQRLGEFGRDNFTIDYHGDDSELGIGGYTRAGSAKIQVAPGMLTKDAKTLAGLMLHEGCHEVDGTIIDCGYYRSARFDKMSQKEKRTNAAHYEEVGRRALDNSLYGNEAFVPEAQQKKKTNRKDELVRNIRPASEGLRKFWSESLNLHALLRDIAAGTSDMAPDTQKLMAKFIKQAFELPQATYQGAPLVTELDLALLEASIKVFNRARTEIKKFTKAETEKERIFLCSLSPGELFLEAIKRVGGFQGVDPALNITFITGVRTAMIVGGIGDPFPEFDGSGEV
jgi:hypothetical protein